MRILVTGSCGFVGHHIVRRLLQEHHEVVGLDRFSHSGNMNRVRDLNYTVWHHDLRSSIHEHLRKQLGTFDYIFHVAASSHVDRSIEDPLSFVLDNVVGTCTMLEFARTQKSLKKFVYFSTDEVFGPAPPGVAYDEYDRYNSTNPYSATKAGGEELAVAFHNTYKIPVLITHTMNVFGPRQHVEKFIPKCIRKICQGEVIEIHSDSMKQKAGSRFYIHAEDVADALVFLMSIETPGCQKFNIVGKEEVDNLELAQMIAHALNKELKYEFVDFHSSRPGHDLRYALSGKRMADLGWTPSKSVRERIDEVVHWSLSHEEWL